MTFFKRIIYYLNPATFFSKKNSDDPQKENVNLKMMHGVNRLSIFMFLFCMIVLIYRLFLR
ncbi:MAG: DUF6728 family protein [Bacteroidota bacterium]